VRAQSQTKPFLLLLLLLFLLLLERIFTSSSSSTRYSDVYIGAVRRPQCVVQDRKKEKFRFFSLSDEDDDDGHLNRVFEKERERENRCHHYYDHIITCTNTGISNFVYTYACSSSQSSHFFYLSGREKDGLIENIKSF